MRAMASWIVQALREPDDPGVTSRLRTEVMALCRRHPVPGVA
jgi:glycine/serine hydroxymethyltransferase